MNKSESIDKLAIALSKAQATILGSKKEQNNPFFHSKYSDLNTCWISVREHLTTNGLSITQLPGKVEVTEAGRTISLETVLMHSSGQYISTEASLPVTKPDAHGCASAITYLRRISLSSILSLTAYEQDDDGNASVDPKTVKKKGKGSHSPTDGAMDELSKEEYLQAEEIALDIISCFEGNKPIEAYELLHESDLSNEIQLGVWELLKPHSAMRRELKKMKADNNTTQH
jgi:hypothetical protein|tara:strand:+ start:141 stop:827 length:687 start_codon:yes stop_codon:yes gene_type:complete